MAIELPRDLVTHDPSRRARDNLDRLISEQNPSRTETFG
jgi:hypothetical protein